MIVLFFYNVSKYNKKAYISMPGIARLRDLNTGCGCCGPVSDLSGSTNVLVNSMPAVTVGMYWNAHTCSECSHPIFTIAGKATVLINGMPTVRMGDTLSDGSCVMGGSVNVVA